MKRYIRCNSFNGYLYIFKHGTGPGTLPKDVAVIKEKSLPNGYTAVWLDRFLSSYELKAYDIPSETQINKYLGWINYCQKDGDVVPCTEDPYGFDDVIGACDKKPVEAATDSNKYTIKSVSDEGTYYLVKDWRNNRELWVSKEKMNKHPEWWFVSSGKAKQSLKSLLSVMDEYLSDTFTIVDMTGNETPLDVKELGFDHIPDYEDDVDACSKVTASKKIVASKMRDIDLLMEKALECTTKDELSAVIGGLDSLGLRKLYLHYMEMLRDDSLSVGYIASDLSDTLYNMFSSKVNACDDIEASNYTIPDKKLVFEDGDSYEFRYTSGEGDVFEPKSGSGNWWTSYIVTPDNRLLSWEFSGRYTPVDAVYGKDFWVEAASEENIESATDAKYFANMVSASNDPELDDDFLIEGYYDNQRKGLAESAETSDVSALNELANEYANKGYYIVVHNLTDGVITEFSADNWFNDIAPDGGASLFMSW